MPTRVTGEVASASWPCTIAVGDAVLASAEIQNLHRAIRAHLHVGRFQVAMDDALGMGLVHCLDDLARDGSSASSTASGPLRDQLCKRRSLDEFHRDERLRIDRANLVDRADADHQARRMPRLAAESRVRLGVAVDRDFEGHLSAQLQIARRET